MGLSPKILRNVLKIPSQITVVFIRCAPMGDRISIVVSTFQRKEKLIRLLESFSRLRCSCPLEFVLVDNCSEDGTGNVITDWAASVRFADVQYRMLRERVPLVRSRNAGIAMSTGNIIAFTDDDCEVDPGWVEQLYQRLRSSTDYAGAGGRVLPLGDDLYSRYFTVFGILEPPRHINAVITANCIFHKGPVADAGLFDEYFTELGGEEIALCMKLWNRGYRFGFEERAVVHHEYRQGLRNFARTFYRDGKGDRLIAGHDPDQYLRFMQYPEQVYGYLAFRHPFVFPFVFLLRMIGGILLQYPSLHSRVPSRKDRILLVGLHACAQFSYHLGRGTVTGMLGKRVRDYRARNPGAVLPVP